MDEGHMSKCKMGKAGGNEDKCDKRKVIQLKGIQVKDISVR